MTNSDIKITSLASSSKGNCYLIEDLQTTLLLECGISITKIREGLDFKLSSVKGALISHHHLDHSRSIQVLMRHGIDCYTSQGTIDAMEITGHRIHQIEAKKQFKIGTWTIVPFDVIHDAAEPLGFLLASGKEKILFCTDSAYIPHKFKGLTHIMIEANYLPKILDRNIESGAVSITQKNRLLFSHMSLDNVLKFLESIDRSKLQEIFLLHLSRDNSNARLMQRAVAALTGVPVHICEE